jgi:hypothetical protein
MNLQPSTTTTVRQTLLIRHGHNYFENGPTRRIKNLTYSLMPVDHNAIVRKGAEGYRALTVFAELINIATCCSQRGLVVDAQEGPITAKRIARTTGMSEPDASPRSGLELLANKYLKSISSVACHNATPSSPIPNAVACHTQTPTLTPLHPVARHNATSLSSTPSTVACHIKRVAIQKVSAAATGISDPDIRASPEPIANKELNSISPVACHNATPPSPIPNAVACHTEDVAIQKKLTTIRETNHKPLARKHG